MAQWGAAVLSGTRPAAAIESAGATSHGTFDLQAHRLSHEVGRQASAVPRLQRPPSQLASSPASGGVGQGGR
jgi:hypothetical protein